MSAMVEQVKALLPEGTRLTDEQITALLEQAEAYLYARIPDLDQRLRTGKTTRAAVDLVQASMVARIARNPEGYRAETDGDYSYQVDTRAAAGFLTLLPDELTMLGSRRGAFTITPDRPQRLRARGLPQWLDKGWR